MRRTLRPVAAAAVPLLALIALLSALFVLNPQLASAQDLTDTVVNELERDGYYIEPGGEGSDSRFADLVRQGERAEDNWYFVSMADTVPDTFADDIFEQVSPRGNVLVYFVDADGFMNVQLASEQSESIENQALAAFDTDWVQPEDFMTDVISDFDSLRVGSTSSGSTGSTSTGSTSGSSSSGGGFPWLLVGIPVLLIGGFWFMSSRGKKAKAEEDLETAQKIRAELQSELDELANDVLVLSGPTDLTDKTDAVKYYREATDTYLTISDELPQGDELENANLRELSELGARVAHARWQMDAAEAIMDGEELPEKPKVAPPPPPKTPAAPRTQQQQRRQMPQRQPRPRVPYSRSRRRSGGGLLDILIAGAGMMGGRSGGGMFGGSSRGRSNTRSGGGMFGGNARTSQPAPRRGGGVFGSRPSSRGSSRSSSRSSSRRSSGRASTSRRRRRSRGSRQS